MISFFSSSILIFDFKLNDIHKFSLEISLNLYRIIVLNKNILLIMDGMLKYFYALKIYFENFFVWLKTSQFLWYLFIWYDDNKTYILFSFLFFIYIKFYWSYFYMQMNFNEIIQEKKQTTIIKHEYFISIFFFFSLFSFSLHHEKKSTINIKKLLPKQ